MLAERAYAKINLTLDVVGRRPDGYHEVDMVMQTIDLSDLIWLERIESGLQVGSPASHIPLDHRNLAYMAAAAFLKHTRVSQGVRIWIEKQIPVAAGLAGGSADAAAVLRGMNRLFGTGLTLDELADIGAAIGSDVPFCVYGGCAVATGRGERIRRLAHPLKAWVVLVHPPVHVSTADVYGAVTPADYAARPLSPRMTEALIDADVDEINHLVRNGLQPITEQLYPEVALLRQRMANVAKVPVHMSGSGPTLYCLTPTQSAGQRLYNAFRGFAKEVYLSRFV
ncbi:4-(cytidine 5'-diphospho)-2-C-methyl-D-erythritol kinase [Alicyclobacillus cycloheptanicus]|uniref:4-diphosphocytidyl-2-C-methyl-D-erythritol kinase n=1 Tax=Alicyclobacillus cycloheptanicus TaxID=1457 RepID=A0ABT9XIM9_9BACL|nr:4-(cytidine 5'-diphospho)-2-C-methyl-D-erythritol kinase [Alicyclobacillus cycloheptanicus]MDQ0190166.1 4-diphosphocytidyl-2-C-methyl-D-erythritol kinase [Alicyclobacillus cycloheptanicus]WDM02915.1 4-(cytidine 5'-diphospho)-2-C-methyl-D-erythritol kinase [Alicyclobacillus cycloheptanicus]